MTDDFIKWPDYQTMPTMVGLHDDVTKGDAYWLF